MSEWNPMRKQFRIKKTTTVGLEDDPAFLFEMAPLKRGHVRFLGCKNFGTYRRSKSLGLSTYLDEQTS